MPGNCALARSFRREAWVTTLVCAEQITSLAYRHCGAGPACAVQIQSRPSHSSVGIAGISIFFPVSYGFFSSQFQSLTGSTHRAGLGLWHRPRSWQISMPGFTRGHLISITNWAPGARTGHGGDASVRLITVRPPRSLGIVGFGNPQKRKEVAIGRSVSPRSCKSQPALARSHDKIPRSSTPWQERYRTLTTACRRSARNANFAAGQTYHT